MRAVDVIRRKRDGGELTREEVHEFVSAFARGEIPDYQMSAWLMAVVIRGMSRAEISALTEAMLHSGSILDFSDLPALKVDKHSTGGVGDKTSLVVAPIAAAGGLFVPMISGRGLGHTGGTFDKLASIPGFNVALSRSDFRRVLETCGCAMSGQSQEIAPADRKMYALRDVTGTVESAALVCASIMSKKMAEGIDALVLDVKCGSGAFMKNMQDARGLADLLVGTGKGMGKKVVALVTNMNQPLGRKVGNTLEVFEALEVLSGAGPDDLRELCMELSAWMLYLGGRAKTVAEGKTTAAALIASGAAREKFREIVKLHGGDVSIVDDPQLLPRARYTAEVVSPADGHIADVDCEQLGMASVVLGGGRETQDDVIDNSVGLEVRKRIGDAVQRGETICTLFYNAGERWKEAHRRVEASFRVEQERPATKLPLIHSVIT